MKKLDKFLESRAIAEKRWARVGLHILASLRRKGYWKRMGKAGIGRESEALRMLVILL